MPGRHHPTILLDPSLCKRCQVEEPVVTVRTERLCKTCFSKYVTTKVVKRMETFRVRHSQTGQERALLLPISLGPGSVTLLHLLSQHLKGQAERTGRTGFRLHVLHVQDTTGLDDADKSMLLDKVKLHFPEHVYSVSSLSETPVLTNLLSVVAKSERATLKETPKLDDILVSFDSATSRADFLRILKLKHIVSFAKAHDCEAILWADSTTTLAERTLAETAKGRGFSLPWVVADGESPHDVPFYYPLRELLTQEIGAFISLADPPLSHLVLDQQHAPPVSTRNTTIDDLMKAYFTSVERDYPSIVANVVRTTSKLQAPSLTKSEQQCELCEMPLNGRSPERSRLCYGCIRTCSIQST